MTLHVQTAQRNLASDDTRRSVAAVPLPASLTSRGASASANANDAFETLRHPSFGMEERGVCLSSVSPAGEGDWWRAMPRTRGRSRRGDRARGLGRRRARLGDDRISQNARRVVRGRHVRGRELERTRDPRRVRRRGARSGGANAPRSGGWASRRTRGISSRRTTRRRETFRRSRKKTKKRTRRSGVLGAVAASGARTGASSWWGRSSRRCTCSRRSRPRLEKSKGCLAAPSPPPAPRGGPPPRRARSPTSSSARRGSGTCATSKARPGASVWCSASTGPAVCSFWTRLRGRRPRRRRRIRSEKRRRSAPAHRGRLLRAVAALLARRRDPGVRLARARGGHRGARRDVRCASLTGPPRESRPETSWASLTLSTTRRGTRTRDGSRRVPRPVRVRAARRRPLARERRARAANHVGRRRGHRARGRAHRRGHAAAPPAAEGEGDWIGGRTHRAPHSETRARTRSATTRGVSVTSPAGAGL